MLNDGKYTCVLCSGDKTYTSTERGIKPLIDLISSGDDFRGFSAADKIVGKAAAMLYIVLGVCEVYSPVMSEAAICILSKNGIACNYKVSVTQIINRKGTAICPMEETVQSIDDPQKALSALKEKICTMNVQ